MKWLWEFPEESRPKLVEGCLGKYGVLTGELRTPNSSIFTFDGGAGFQRYVVAKGIRTPDGVTVTEKRQFLMRALGEVSNAHSVCHHPSIQRFFDVEIVFGVPFLLSRKRDATLRDVIAEGPVSETEALGIAMQVVRGLLYARSKLILCHQDLKPENVFVDIRGMGFAVPERYPFEHRVLIADFELANAYRILRHPYGSRPYMAPEQYLRLPADQSLPDFSRVDVFAMGVILYELLSGGVHPIGEHISLVWPVIADGKSRKWAREDPWKQWAWSGALMAVTEASEMSEGMAGIIQDCLRPEALERLTLEGLDDRLSERLKGLNESAWETMSMLLKDFDRLADEGDAAGWPYYDNRVRQLNEAYSDLSSL